jgi:hypothetical protein
LSTPAQNDEEALIAQRKQAAWLLEAVMDERMEARLAINSWPERVMGSDDGIEHRDLSLDAAYQALWYFESDEERHQNEMFYLDAQLELLRQMATFLKQGKELPAYMIRHYTPESYLQFYYPRNFWRALIHDTKHQIAAWAKAWKSALRL